LLAARSARADRAASGPTFEGGRPAADIVDPDPFPFDHYASESAPLAERDVKRPVFVLTAKETFSAGEGLAFLLIDRELPGPGETRSSAR
jgi:hypothetical protein